MPELHAALWTEAIKAARSRTSWLTALGFSLAPLVGGMFMLLFKDPDLASRFGLLTTKAQLTVAEADWPTYFGLLSQATAVGGLVVFGLVVSWLFGREYNDGMAKDLLALPISRPAIVTAKFIIAVVWCAALGLLVFGLGLGIGGAIGLTGWSLDLARRAAGDHAVTTVLTIVLVRPLAWVASAGRGYMAPVGAMFLLLVMSQILGATGWGVYFPWSVPALFAGIAGPDGPALHVVSFVGVAVAGLAGVAGTLAWWQYADQT